jgi:dTMP kinase
MFLALDGIDGAGKSTQLDLLCPWLEAHTGRGVVRCADPGSTALGQRVRAILLDGHDLAIGRRAEMLLFMAARAQLVEEVIAPALAAGQTVVSDRYLLANVVYQGHAGGLDVDALWQIGQLATAGVSPDLTIVLDLDPVRAASRISRPADRMERQSPEFFARLRAGFVAEARRRPRQIVLVDADREPQLVQEDIRQQVGRVLASRSAAE